MQNGNAYDEGLDNDFWKPSRITGRRRRRSARSLEPGDHLSRFYLLQ
jgi:hypothetical protein